MYQADTNLCAGELPGAATRLVLERVRKALTAPAGGVRLDPSRMIQILLMAAPPTGLEAECAFALGWLHWLRGDFAAAESPLAEAICLTRRAEGAAPPIEAAYWRGRVGVLRGRADALSEYETVLRETRGEARAVAWLVDLLWRAGRIDRAEQVWKSVRANKKVAACDEGPLLEARSLLRRGEAASAERVLADAPPGRGVVRVERGLLLAWAFTESKQYDRAAEAFEQAKEGPYPPAALESWRILLDKRRTAQSALPDEAGRPSSLAALLRGQEALRDGDKDAAVAAFREAASVLAAQAFARYALACLGEDDFSALLASQPGLFLALRCRARSVLERFRRREATAAEWLDAARQAASVGWRDATAEHFRRVAQLLQLRRPTAEVVYALASSPEADPAQRRNVLRAGVETAVRRLPPGTALGLLLLWSDSDDLSDDLRVMIGRQLLRSLLLGRAAVFHTAEAGERKERVSDDAVLAAVDRLLPGDDLTGLVRAWLNPGASPPPPAGGDAPGFARLWRAAVMLAGGGKLGDGWRAEVRGLRSQDRLKAPAQALLLSEAARRGDATAVSALLEETDSWRGFHGAPPHFVTAAVAAIVAAQPNHPGWRRSLGRWVQQWGADALGPDGAALAARAGLRSAGVVIEPPAGAPPAPWFLHQAARAQGGDAALALAHLRRALDADPELTPVTDADVVRAALPELERRAAARALAAAARPDEAVPMTTTALLVDAVDLIVGLPDGACLLEAAVRSGPDVLAGRPDLPARLAHHLALLSQHTAEALEDADRGADAEPYWRTAWRLWLLYLANPEPPAGAEPTQVRTVLLDWLLAGHRRRITEQLARGAVDAARRHWALVCGLPQRASEIDESLGRDLAGRCTRFRDELATDYLLATRDAMRYGAIPEGWRADYGRGLSGVQRLLSLDRDNLRLLTAIVEICDEWFLDLYNAGDPKQLAGHVERFTPFAAQLARLTEGRSGDLAARAALSDFYKFRGFVAGDRGRKVELYREALRFNPGNGNVRSLLAELGEPAEPPAAADKKEGGPNESV